MELSGFKSFADRTVVSFPGGILCVVGPNGCGKSNLVDAFRWVLGEQSVKSLRSDKMEEVIFQGSSAKKQKGLAEVSLTFATQTESEQASRSSQPNVRDEVTLTRRLYRSGESEYLLNKRQCRLKDLRDILLGAGIDPKSYAIFDNMRVSEILNARPHERRFILEEIAGVAKYKIKKTEADAKLEASRQNLTRISDIIYEVKRQMSNLERQVRKAEKYKKLIDELRLIELRIAKMKHSDLTSKISSLTAEIEKLSADEASFRAEYSSIENNIEAKKLAITGLQGEVAFFREKLARVEMSLSNAEKGIAVLKTLIESKNAEIARLKHQIETSHAKKLTLQNKLSEIEENEQMLRTEIETLADELRDKRLLLQDIASNLDEKDVNLELKRRELFSIAELISTKKNEYSKISASLENLKYRESVSIRDIENIRASIGVEEKSIKELESSHGSMQSELKELLEKREINQKEAAHIQRQMEEKNALLHRGKENIASLMSRLESSQELIGENPFSDILQDERKNAFRHSLADFIKVHIGYENAIEAAFAEKINSLIINKKEDLFAAIKIIKERNLSRTCLLYTGLKNNGAAKTNLIPTESKDGNIFTNDSKEKNPEAQKAAELVAFELNGRKEKPSDDMILSVKRTASELLLNIYVANDLNTALEIHHNKGLNNQAIVTLDGEIITPEGIIIAGKGKEILKRKHEINELYNAIAKEKIGIENLKKELMELASYNSRLRDVLKSIDFKTAELQKVIVVNEQNHKNLRDDIQRKHQKISFLETDIKSISREQSSLEKTLFSISEEIKRLETKKGDISNELSSIQNSLAAIKEEHQTTSEQINDLRLSINTCREKVNAFNREKNSISDMLAEMQKKNDSAKREISEGEKKLAASTNELEDLNNKIKLFLEDSNHIKVKLSGREKEIYTLNQEVIQRESELKRLRSETDELSKNLSRLKTELMEYRLRTENIADMIMQKYSIEIDNYIFESSGYNTEQDEEDLDRITKKIHEFGAVNLGTIEEFKELKGRYEFMMSQKEDLETSISELEDAITRINNTTKKKLQDAYSTMRIKFSEVFSELFGGGKADIILTEQDDILHSGIEIIAQPPGKKLQNINLLSGGEKALTTLALMFAGFFIRPMPLCILDEVDAPLDESNTTRFAQMLRRCSQSTQFLIITHNRATMEVADFLYGITMEEPGVSKLISLKFAGDG